MGTSAEEAGGQRKEILAMATRELAIMFDNVVSAQTKEAPDCTNVFPSST